MSAQIQDITPQTPPPGGTPELSLDGAIERIRQHFGVPRTVVDRMIKQESGGSDNAESYLGAQGRFQIEPGTLRLIENKTGKKLDINNPLDNAYAGLWLLKNNYDQVRPRAKSERHAWMMSVAGYHGPLENVLADLNNGGDGIPDQGDGLINTRDHVFNIFSGTKPEDFAPEGKPQEAVSPTTLTPEDEEVDRTPFTKTQAEAQPSIPPLKSSPAADLQTEEGRQQRDIGQQIEGQPNARILMDIGLPPGKQDWTQVSGNELARIATARGAAQRGVPSGFIEQWLKEHGGELKLYNLQTGKEEEPTDLIGTPSYDEERRTMRVHQESVLVKQLVDDYKLEQLRSIPGYEDIKSLQDVPETLRALTVEDRSPGEKFLAVTTPVVEKGLKAADYASRPFKAVDAAFWSKLRGADNVVSVAVALNAFTGGDPELGKSLISDALEHSDRLKEINPRLPSLLGGAANMLLQPSNLIPLEAVGALAKGGKLAEAAGEAGRGLGVLDRGMVEARPLGVLDNLSEFRTPTLRPTGNAGEAIDTFTGRIFRDGQPTPTKIVGGKRVYAPDVEFDMRASSTPFGARRDYPQGTVAPPKKNVLREGEIYDPFSGRIFKQGQPTLYRVENGERIYGGSLSPIGETARRPGALPRFEDIHTPEELSVMDTFALEREMKRAAQRPAKGTAKNRRDALTEYATQIQNELARRKQFIEDKGVRFESLTPIDPLYEPYMKEYYETHGGTGAGVPEVLKPLRTERRIGNAGEVRENEGRFQAGGNVTESREGESGQNFQQPTQSGAEAGNAQGQVKEPWQLSLDEFKPQVYEPAKAQVGAADRKLRLALDMPEGERKVNAIAVARQERADALARIGHFDTEHPETAYARVLDQAKEAGKDVSQELINSNEQLRAKYETAGRRDVETVGLEGQTVEGGETQVEQPGGEAKVSSESEARAGETEAVKVGDEFDFLGERLKIQPMPLNRARQMERVRVVSLTEPPRKIARGVEVAKQKSFSPAEFEQTFGRKLELPESVGGTPVKGEEGARPEGLLLPDEQNALAAEYKELSARALNKEGKPKRGASKEDLSRLKELDAIAESHRRAITQMTRDEYADLHKGRVYKDSMGRESTHPGAGNSYVTQSDNRYHQYLVGEALKRGESVPERVLADYPDLAKKHVAPSPTRAETPPQVQGRAKVEKPSAQIAQEVRERELQKLNTAGIKEGDAVTVRTRSGVERATLLRVDGEAPSYVSELPRAIYHLKSHTGREISVGASDVSLEPAYSPAIQDAFKAWNENRAYVDGAGNYRLRPEAATPTRKQTGRVAPWNREVKSTFKDPAEFHAAAQVSGGSTKATSSGLGETPLGGGSPESINILTGERVEPGREGERGALPLNRPQPPKTAEQAVVQKVTDLIKAAKPARETTESLYTAERGRRLAGFKTATTQGGEQGALAGLGRMKGELPKAGFEPIRPQLSQPEADTLYNMIFTNPRVRDWEQVTAVGAMRKLFDPSVAVAPTRSELAVLERIYGQDFVKAVLSKRSFGQKAWENFLAVTNLPRTIAASFDLSAPLRQGVVLTVNHPVKAIRAGKDMVRAFVSERWANAIRDSIEQSPLAKVREDAGLFMSEWGGSAQTLSAREEAFMSHLAQKIPGVAQSERAYVTYLNKLRADVFDSVVAAKPGATKKDLEGIANFINLATGRGSLGKLEGIAPILNNLFFSPRYATSRFQIWWTPFSPKATPFAGAYAAKQLVQFVGSGVSLITLASLIPGVQVGKDPRSSDFGKMRVGKTTIDIWGGFAQTARLVAQEMMGQSVSPKTGKVTDLTNPTKAVFNAQSGGVSVRPNDMNRVAVLGNFLRGKESPQVGFLHDVVSGSNFRGEPANMKTSAKEHFLPMGWSDVHDAVVEDRREGGSGFKGGLMGMLSLFGVGVQTEQPRRRSLQSNQTALPPPP